MRRGRQRWRSGSRALLIVALAAALVLPVSVSRAWAGPDEIRDVLVDEGYRLRLMRPGPDWVLLDEKAVGARFPGAVLGAADSHGTSGRVSVAPPPAGTLEEVAHLHVQRPAAPGVEVKEPTRLRYLDHDAVRLEARYDVAGVGYVEQDTFFLHEGQCYVVEAQALQTTARASRGGLAAYTFSFFKAEPPTPEDVERVFEAFHVSLELLPGKVKARDLFPSQGISARGVGWRIADGAFESSISGLRVVPPAGWAFLVGDALLRINPFAEVGLLHPRTGAVVLVIDEKSVGLSEQTYDALIVGQISASLGLQPQPPPRKVTFLGDPRPFVRFALPHPFPRELAYGTRTTSTRAFQVQAYAADSRLEASWSAIPEVIEAFSPIPEASRASLARTLGAASDPQMSLAKGAGLRGGTWRDLTLGISWRKPSVGWRVLLPQEAPVIGNALFLAQDRESNASVKLERVGVQGIVFDTANDDWRHEYLARGFFGPEASRTPVTTIELGSVEARRSHVSSPLEGAAGTVQHLELVTFRWRKETFAIIVAMPTATGVPAQDVQARFDAAVTGLAFEDPDSWNAGRSSNRIEDRRLGFTFTMKGEGWAVRDETPESFVASGSLLHALGPQQHAIVTATITPMDLESSSRALFERAQSILGTRLPDGEFAPFHEEVWNDLPAVRRTWTQGKQRMELLATRRENVLFAIVLASRPDGSGVTLDEVKAGLDFLP